MWFQKSYRPAGHEPGPSPAPAYPSPWIRLARRWLIIVLLVAGFVEFCGLPYLRVTYRYNGSSESPIYIDGTYWSFVGKRHVMAGEHAEGLPLLLMIPMDQSLFTHATEALTGLWEYTNQQIQNS